MHAEVKEWVAININRWRVEKAEWFKIEDIPNEFLTAAVLGAEGGANRKRRSSLSQKVKIDDDKESSKVHPAND